jgi:hypothetical protein
MSDDNTFWRGQIVGPFFKPVDNLPPSVQARSIKNKLWATLWACLQALTCILTQAPQSWRAIAIGNQPMIKPL